MYEDFIKEDERLLLTHFTNYDAFILGTYIGKIANDKKFPISIRIEKNEQIIFQYANDGTAINNEYWLTRKINVVKRFAKSSGLIAAKLAQEKLSFKDKYGDDSDYAATPGAVPIKVIGVGIVGIIAISGLSSQDDHDLIVSGIKYLMSLESGEK